VITRRRLLRRAGLVCLALLAVPAAFAAWWWMPPAGLDAWRSGPPPGSWAVRDAQVAVWREAGSERQVAFDYRSLEAIPIDMQLAVLVGEDINFFAHQGIDFTAVQEAVDEWRAGEGLRGASTVSQQLAKNLFLSNERSWLRKLREARLTRHLEAELGKRRILELYLNVIEFGEGIFGVEAAARSYYERGVERLSADEAAGLAATIPAPHVSNPATATRAWQNRKAVIVTRMDHAGWLRDLLTRQQGERRPARDR
jgi:monofunctional biosynthetic peptidoglycan transglycosylase